MKKVLIITYYWPPAGGPGVQRWLKFVKYFRDFGVEPIVFTVENAKYPIIDTTLVKEIPKKVEILRLPIWEPNHLFSFFGKKKTESIGFLNPNPSLFGKLMQYVRANYFIPDARKYWVRPSVTYLQKYLKKNKVDVVITTGPPHSLHLIGLRLKERINIKWIADFRDPWTEIDHFHQLPLTKKSIKKHQTLEENVLKSADAVLVVGNTMKEKYHKFNDNVITITNGFDTELIDSKIELDSTFTLTHIGLMNADRNPQMLWDVLAEIVKEDTSFGNNFELKLIGKVDSTIRVAIATYNLSKNIQIIDYVSHNEVIAYQKKSQVLLVIVNNVPNASGIVTGKVFEYLMAKRPILAIAPVNGDLSEIVKETNAGVVVEFDDRDTLKKTILEMYSNWKHGKLFVNSENIGQYHRRELTKKVSELINKITE